jgi:hypothetical protein
MVTTAGETLLTRSAYEPGRATGAVGAIVGAGWAEPKFNSLLCPLHEVKEKTTNSKPKMILGRDIALL